MEGRGSQSITIFLAALLLCVATSALAEPPIPNNRFNVLFIAVDDLRPELGCYGKDYVDTPNIDKLASTGVTFLQHFVAVPTCGASRHALLTGRSPLSSGVRNGNKSMYKLIQDELPGAQTLPELFNRSGYHTVLIGKVSHTADGKVTHYDGTGDGRPELPGAWDEFVTPYGPWKRGWGVFFAYADGKHREDGGGHRDLMQFSVEIDTDLPDGLLAEAAVAKLKALKDKASGGEPFFMGLGFYKPHLPFVAPKHDWDAVRLWDVPRPMMPERTDTAYYNGGNGEFYSYKMPWEKTKPLPPDGRMQAKHGYLACVRYIDRQIGKVLDALEAEGLADNTVVVLWGDHGWFLGETAMWAKHTPLETALHSPLIIRAPGIAKPGIKTNALASTIDIYPTLVDLCQPSFTKTEHELDGVSLLPVITGTTSNVRKVVPSYWRDATSYRGLDYRLIHKGDLANPNSVELYALGKETGALINIADENPEIVTRIFDVLRKQ